MQKIAIIGSGRVGQTLSRGLLQAGFEVVIGSRIPAETQNRLSGIHPLVLSQQEAILGSEMVINATPGVSSLETFAELRSPMQGKLLVDVANATTRNPDGSPGQLVYPQDSLAERLQALLPDTRIVKTLNTMLAPVMVAPRLVTGAATVFMSGDSEPAKQAVRAFLLKLEWKEEQILDLGSLYSARAVEAMVQMVPFLVRTQGFRSFALSAVY